MDGLTTQRQRHKKRQEQNHDGLLHATSPPIIHLKIKRASHRSTSITIINKSKGIAEQLLIPPHTNLANPPSPPPHPTGNKPTKHTPSRSPVYPDHPRIGHSQITPSLRGGDLSSETDRAKAWLSLRRKTRKKRGSEGSKEEGTSRGSSSHHLSHLKPQSQGASLVSYKCHSRRPTSRLRDRVLVGGRRGEVLTTRRRHRHQRRRWEPSR